MSGGDEYRDASRRRPLSVPLSGVFRAESNVESSSSNGKVWTKYGSMMATRTTTRLHAVNTCGEEMSPSAEEKTTTPPSSSPSSPSSLRNCLTSCGAEEVGKINGYTLTSNGHVHVSNRRESRPSSRLLDPRPRIFNLP